MSSFKVIGILYEQFPIELILELVESNEIVIFNSSFGGISRKLVGEMEKPDPFKDSVKISKEIGNGVELKNEYSKDFFSPKVNWPKSTI